MWPGSAPFAPSAWVYYGNLFFCLLWLTAVDKLMWSWGRDGGGASGFSENAVISLSAFPFDAENLMWIWLFQFLSTLIYQEIFCFYAEDHSCPYGTAKCKSGQCIPQKHWCDFVSDCPDFSDEDECGKWTTLQSFIRRVVITRFGI